MSRKPELYFAVARGVYSDRLRVVGVTTVGGYGDRQFWGREYHPNAGATHGRVKDILGRHDTIEAAYTAIRHVEKAMPELNRQVNDAYEFYQAKLRYRDARMRELASVGVDEGIA